MINITVEQSIESPQCRKKRIAFAIIRLQIYININRLMITKKLIKTVYICSLVSNLTEPRKYGSCWKYVGTEIIRNVELNQFNSSPLLLSTFTHPAFTPFLSFPLASELILLLRCSPHLYALFTSFVASTTSFLLSLLKSSPSYVFLILQPLAILISSQLQINSNAKRKKKMLAANIRVALIMCIN